MQEKKRILILGAGISGLATAFFLTKQGYDCQVLEKEKGPGGCIQTEEKEGVFLEKGPRVFQASRSESLLALIHELELSPFLVFSKKKLPRFLFTKGSFKKMPPSFFQLFFSKFYRPLLYALCTEWRVPPLIEDETIWEFGCRRFSRPFTEQFLDPMVLGIYAGDCKKLSVLSCFSVFKEWERQFGCITYGFVRSLFSKKKKRGGLFSLQGGMGVLIQKLAQELSEKIFYEQEVISLQKKDGQFFVQTNQREFIAEEVVLALQAPRAACLLQSIAEQAALSLSTIPMQTVTSINVVIQEPLPIKGFGYLVPSKEKEPVLGVLFDSYICEDPSCIKFTIMAWGALTQEEVQERVDCVLKKHLHLTSCCPAILSYTVYAEGIPQYLIGHTQKIVGLQQLLPQGVYLVGNYLDGVSVNDCIFQAQKIADIFRSV